MENNNISIEYQNRIRIKCLLEAGMSPTEISRHLKCSRQTVYNMKKKGKTIRKKRVLWNRKLCANTKKFIKRNMKEKHGVSDRKCAAKLNSSLSYQKCNKTISRRTVQRYRKSTNWGKYAYSSQSKPLLSQKNIDDRIKFGQIVENAGFLTKGPRAIELIDNILFTDESHIQLYPKLNKRNNPYYTSEKSQVPITPCPKKSLSIMVAGGVCANGLTKLHIVEKDQKVTGKYYQEKIIPIYIEALKTPKVIYNKRKVTFVQDGAPCHGTKDNMQLLESNFQTVWGKGKWPGNSPDLNPIEHLWSILKESIHKNPRPRNREELIKRVEKAWSEIDKNTIKNICRSFPKRIQEMLNASGGSTDY